MFKKNSMPLLAVEHAIETGNFEKSIQFLGEIAETMWENGHHSAIMKYGDLLPDDIIKKNVDFCLYYSWILIIAGQVQKASPFLVSAEKITKDIIDNKNSSKEEVQYNKKRLGKISVAFAYLNSFGKCSEKTFDYCKTAMENLSEDDPLWFSWDGTQKLLQKWYVKISRNVSDLMKKHWTMVKNQVTSISSLPLQ